MAHDLSIRSSMSTATYFQDEKCRLKAAIKYLGDDSKGNEIVPSALEDKERTLRKLRKDLNTVSDILEMICDRSDFQVLEKLGSGAYGVCFSGINNKSISSPSSSSSPMTVALKFFGYSQNRPEHTWIYGEIMNLAALRKVDGVCKILGIFDDTDEGIVDSNDSIKHFRTSYPVIVMEKLDKEVFNSIECNNEFSERDASIIFKKFISTLNNVHKARVINCDLKIANLVFRNPNDLEVVIIDFGVAKFLEETQDCYKAKDRIGTPLLEAPETIHGNEYSFASDIWQAGEEIECFYC